jgi:hypothetical protein
VFAEDTCRTFVRPCCLKNIRFRDRQGPEHSDPIDYLNEWSVLQSKGQFTIRVEKPIRIPEQNSCPEPDLAWVARRRYFDQHPNSLDVFF